MFCDWCKHKMMPSENWRGVELDGKKYSPLCSHCYNLISLVRSIERKNGNNRST